jgi:Sulfotransferase domain
MKKILNTNIKIFNFGLPRTGTTSFHTFMEKNGFNSLHSNDASIEYIYPDEYNKFKNNKNSAICKIINKYQVFSDLPWYSLYDDIFKIYHSDQSCYFVATTRNVEKWCKSIKKLRHWIPDKNTNSYKYHDNIYNGLLTSLYNDNDPLFDEKLKIFFNEHYENLIKIANFYKRDILFLDLEDTESIKKKLSNIFGCIPYDYPKKNINQYE